MNVVTTIVGAEVEGFADGKIGKVLTAERDDFALGDEAGEFIFAGVGQGAQLDSTDLCTDGWCEIGCFCSLGEEILERSVGIFAVFVVIELGQRGVFLLCVPCWKVIGVL